MVHNNINNIYQSTYQLQASSSVSCFCGVGLALIEINLVGWSVPFVQLSQSGKSLTHHTTPPLRFDFCRWVSYFLPMTWLPPGHQACGKLPSREGRKEQAVEWNEVEFPDLQNLTSPMYSFMVLMFLAHTCTYAHTCIHMQIEIKATSQWPPSKWSLVRIPRVSLLLNWDLLRFVQISV